MLGVTEVALLLGVSKQRADQLSRQRDFPLPMTELATGRLWERKDVEAWAKERGRGRSSRSRVARLGGAVRSQL